MITQSRLKELFHYDLETGLFTRLVTIAHNAKAGDIAGTVDSGGYIQIMVDGKRYQAHRLMWLWVTGEWPDEVDHINHVKDDNRWINLREVSRVENCRNQSLPKNNTSGICGVYWYKASKKWMAYIRVSGKLIGLGLFENMLDAIEARKIAENKYKYHENHGKSVGL